MQDQFFQVAFLMSNGTGSPRLSHDPDNEIFVALDLETTGLDVESEEIIEIGIVKFRNSVPIDYYSSFVNPHRPIPSLVQQMTGIDDFSVSSAPSFSILANKIAGFIDELPIIGHNIVFDISFLRKKGLSLGNQSIDTFEMAQILLPRASNYSLSGLMKEVGLPAGTSHRALDDAISAASLFIHLNKVIGALPSATLAKIQDIFSRTSWSLGQFIKYPNPDTFERLDQIPNFLNGQNNAFSGHSLSSKIEQASVDSDALITLMEPNGVLANSMDGFESRPQQIDMVRSVCNAFNGLDHLILEGGTGSGKTLAYLMAAIRFSLLNSVPVVISTHTLNLQEQLITKDIPRLLEALDKETWMKQDNFCFTVFKGQSNYLCTRRWEQLASQQQLTKDEAKLLIKTLVWLSDSFTGDKEEINLIAQDNEVWHKLEVKSAASCPKIQSNQCYYKHAQNKRDTAHLIVVNHSLLVADMATAKGLLPNYRYLIIDEAHQLENDATRELGFTIGIAGLEDRFMSLQKTLSSLRSSSSARQPDNGFTYKKLDRLTTIEGELNSSLVEIRDFDRAVSNFLTAVFVKDRYAQLRIDDKLRETAAWTKIRIVADRVLNHARSLSNRLPDSRDLPETTPSKVPKPYDQRADFSQWVQELEEILDKLHEFVFEPMEGNVYWISLEGKTQDVRFNIRPVEVSSFLKDNLFREDKSVVLTSATLQIANSFTYTRSQLGLDQANEIKIESSFDYKNQALCLVATDVPYPNEPTYINALGNTIVEIAGTIQGHTLVLCTSHGTIRSLRRLIAEPLIARNIRVMAQNIDGSPARLIRSMKNDHTGVLLGAASFWEGVDIGEKAIKAIIITKLPFEPPGDPLFEARAESYEDSFNQYALPQAVLKFRQGFGRLIRSKNDRGVVVIMDSRIYAKPYGSMFLDSLPDCSRELVKRREVSSRILSWLTP